MRRDLWGPDALGTRRLMSLVRGIPPESAVWHVEPAKPKHVTPDQLSWLLQARN